MRREAETPMMFILQMPTRRLPLARGESKGDIGKRIALFLFSALLLTGCSLHTTRVKNAPGEVPPVYSTGINEAAPPRGRWWEQFGDGELNALMEQVLRHNLDIRRAYERLQSLAVAGITDSARGPVVNLESSGGRARQSVNGAVSTKDIYRLSAAARFELDLWGKLRSQSEAAHLDALASEEALKALFISISAQAADLYFLAAEQQLQIELSDRTIASFQDTLDRVERRYREGLVPAIDVYQSRQNLSSAKAQRPLFVQNRAVALNALSVLTGQAPDAGKTGDGAVLPEPPSFNAGLPSQLLEHRPDVKEAFLLIQAQDKRVSAAIADRFPSFNLAGSYGGSSDKVRTVLDSPNIFWNILLEAAQPVIDAGRRRAEVDRAEAALRESLAAYHTTVLQALADVEDALARGSASEERISMLELTVSASEASLRLALDRYLQGLTDYLPVLTEQLRNVTSQSNLLAARRQLISDRIQLARSLGGEWADSISSDYIIRMAEEGE